MDLQIILDAIPEILTQLVAFLLVFFILKKYAFTTIFQILDERQKTIEGSIEESKNRTEELEKLKAEYQTKLQEIEQESRQKIQEAVKEGQQIAVEIKESAREDAKKQVDRAKAEIDRQIQTSQAALRQAVVNLSTDIAEKLIHKNLNDSENEKLIQQAIEQSGELK